jgi:hypothetical protein
MKGKTVTILYEKIAVEEAGRIGHVQHFERRDVMLTTIKVTRPLSDFTWEFRLT